MIRLDKHSNLDYSVANISAFLIKKLGFNGTTKYDDLLEDTIDKIGERASTNFPYALNFLFLLGKLIYDEQTDTFKLNEV